MTPRDMFLQRVKQAVVEGNRAGAAPPLPARGTAGYQGAGPNPLQRFCDEFRAAGGTPHLAADRETAWRVIDEILRGHGARRVLLSRGGMVERLEVPGRLRQQGLEVTDSSALSASGGDWRGPVFAADVAISNVEHLVAETGTLVVATKPEEPRSASLLPPVHIAIADQRQLLPDLFDLFDLFAPGSSPDRLPPACLTLITGPSKTGDIELRLVTGVHGPGEIHVVVCTW